MMVVQKQYFKQLKEKMIDAPTFVYSVLDGYIDGTAFVDPSHDTSTFIHTNSGLSFAAGHPSETLLNHIVKNFEQAIHQQKRFTLFSYDATLNEAIEKRLHTKVQKIRRYAFTFDDTSKSEQSLIQHQYEVTRIQRQHIEQSLEFNAHYYDEYWDATQNFLQHGIGLCVIDQGKIVSEAVSIFKSQQYAEIDIMTDAHYRGQSLASIVGERFIDECISKNIEPRWDCDIDNMSSINLGKKLGFVNPKEYALYIKYI